MKPTKRFTKYYSNENFSQFEKDEKFEKNKRPDKIFYSSLVADKSEFSENKTELSPALFSDSKNLEQILADYLNFSKVINQNLNLKRLETLFPFSTTTTITTPIKMSTEKYSEQKKELGSKLEHSEKKISSTDNRKQLGSLILPLEGNILNSKDSKDNKSSNLATKTLKTTTLFTASSTTAKSTTTTSTTPKSTTTSTMTSTTTKSTTISTTTKLTTTTTKSETTTTASMATKTSTTSTTSKKSINDKIYRKYSTIEVFEKRTTDEHIASEKLNIQSTKLPKTTLPFKSRVKLNDSLIRRILDKKSFRNDLDGAFFKSNSFLYSNDMKDKNKLEPVENIYSDYPASMNHKRFNQNKSLKNVREDENRYLNNFAWTNNLNDIVPQAKPTKLSIAAETLDTLNPYAWNYVLSDSYKKGRLEQKLRLIILCFIEKFSF